MSTYPPALGRHALIDLFGCTVSDPDELRTALAAVAEAAGLRVVGETEHRFSPHGYTAVLLLAESHLALHAWPEHGYAAVDLYSCDPDTPFDDVRDDLRRRLGAERAEIRLLERPVTSLGALP